MRSMRLVLFAVGAALASSAFGVSIASALPLFVSKSGTYPVHSIIHGGLRIIHTTGERYEMHCTLVSGLALLGLRLYSELRLYEKCSIPMGIAGTAACTSPGEPPGLIHMQLHGWFGYLTNAAGEKMVGVLAQPEPGSSKLFECNLNAFEHMHVEVLGEAVGTIGLAELNKLQIKFGVEFKQAAGSQSPQTFLLPSPLSLMTGVHTTWDITGLGSETREAAEEATSEYALLGVEEAEIQG